MYAFPPSFKHRACCPQHAQLWIKAFATSFPRLAPKAADIHAQLNGYKNESELLQAFMDIHLGQEIEEEDETEFMPFDADLISGDTAYLVRHYRITSHAADLFLSMFPVGIDGQSVSAAPFNEAVAYLSSDLHECPDSSRVRANQKRRESQDAFFEDFLDPSLVEILMKRWGFNYKPYYDVASLEGFFMHIGDLHDPELKVMAVLVSPKMILPDQWIADANIVSCMDEEGYCDDGITRLILNPRPMQYKTSNGDRYTCPGFFQSGINLWPMLIPKKHMPLHDVMIECRFFQQAAPELFADEQSVWFDMMRHFLIDLADLEDSMVLDKDYFELANGWLAPKVY